MDFPLHCTFCNTENWIDLDNPKVWKIDNVVYAEGYVCQSCKKPFPFFYKTRSMEDAMMKLRRYDPFNRAFPFILSKVMKKAKGLREKYG
jgi:hypothetical protein